MVHGKAVAQTYMAPLDVSTGSQSKNVASCLSGTTMILFQSPAEAFTCIGVISSISGAPGLAPKGTAIPRTLKTPRAPRSANMSKTARQYSWGSYSDPVRSRAPCGVSPPLYACMTNAPLLFP